MTSDIQFLINCCKTNPTDSDVKILLEYISIFDNQQLSKITLLAHAHGIFPLFYQFIQTHASNLFTDELIEYLKKQNRHIVMQNMRMTAELIRIMDLLVKNSINAVALKGPTLAKLVYGDITHREYSDLDIFIKKEDISFVMELLMNEGFQRTLSLTPSQEKLWIKNAHDIELVHPKNGISIEMHWALVDQDYPININLDDFWNNTQLVTINDQPIQSFSTENLLIFLCIHGSKHLWERVEWIKDIDLLLKTQEVNWDNVIKTTENSDFKLMIYLGLYLTQTFFQTQLPKSVEILVTRDKPIVNLTDRIFEHWQNSNTIGTNKTLQKTTIILKLFPTISMKLSYLHKVILKPSLNEYSCINLPKPLFWFYYLIRPYLLVKKYLFTTKAI